MTTEGPPKFSIIWAASCRQQARKVKIVLNGKELERGVCGQELTAPPNPNHLPPYIHSWPNEFCREKHTESKDARHSGG